MILRMYFRHSTRQPIGSCRFSHRLGGNRSHGKAPPVGSEQFDLITDNITFSIPMNFNYGCDITAT